MAHSSGFAMRAARSKPAWVILSPVGAAVFPIRDGALRASMIEAATSARQYDPRLGRFLQRDPIGPADGTDLYTCVGNTPVIYRDPMGMKREVRWGSAGDATGHGLIPGFR